MGWDTIGNVDYMVKSFTTYNNDLHVGGYFHSINANKYCNRVARWNGSQWVPLSKGITSGNGINTMVEYNGDLYVGGQFTQVDSSISANRIARWDGSQWHAMGTGFTGGITQVNAMAVYNNELIVAGGFNSIDGFPASCICRWNGTNWDSLGPGLNSYAFSLTVDTLNNLLYAGGSFSSAGSTLTPSGIAVWNGSSWAPVGGTPYIGSLSLKFYRNKLFNVGTQNGTVNNFGDTIDYISYYDGINWIPPCRIYQAEAFALEVYNDELYVGGGFKYACDSLVYNLFRYYEPPLLIKENSNEKEFSVFPNPAYSSITINIPGKAKNESGSISIYNTLSKKIISTEIGSANSTVNIQSLLPGIYFLRLTTNENIFTKKFVKE